MITRTLLCLAASVAFARADLVWEKSTQEFHRVPDDKHVEAKFAFKNTGPDTVTIKKVTTSCGCTTAKLAKNTYAPGESGEIDVKFNFGSRRGPQRKIIAVIGEDKREWMLDLRVYIHEPLTLTPALVYWRTGDAPEAKAVKLTTADGQKVAVKSVTSSDKRVSATVSAVKPGEEYLVNVKPADTSAKLAAELTVATDFPPDAPRSYRIFARIK
jgi:hypothetical protein